MQVKYRLFTKKIDLIYLISPQAPIESLLTDGVVVRLCESVFAHSGCNGRVYITLLFSNVPLDDCKYYGLFLHQQIIVLVCIVLQQRIR